MDESWVIPALAENLLDPLFFAEAQASNGIDLEARLASQALRIGTNLIAQRFGESREIKIRIFRRRSSPVIASA